jgi:hypothetical protein
MKRLLLLLPAAVCLVLAAGLLLLATDVGRWRDAMAADDVRYRSEPGARGLWTADTLVPFGLARRMLGVGDDVAFREAVRALRLGRLEAGASSDPALVLKRAEARARLQEIAGRAGDASRRSRAMNLLGVISFSSALTEARGQAAYLQDAASAFTGAIAIDPANAEAKANLELALQKGRALEAAESAGGPNPSPGGSGAKGAGAGEPGTGY